MIFKRLILLVLVINVYCSPSAVVADEGPTSSSTGPLGFGNPWLTNDLESDRARETIGTQCVPPGHFQLETGYLFLYDDEDGNSGARHEFPQTLIRAGLYDDLEMRLAWKGYIVDNRDPAFGNPDNSNGAGNLAVGFKHSMYKNIITIPDLSFLVDLEVPSGSEKVSANDVTPRFAFLWAYNIPKLMSIGGNLDFSAPVDEGGRYFESRVTLFGGMPIGGHVNIFAEYIGRIPNEDALQSVARHTIDGGLIYMFGDNLHLDIRLGFGINEEAPNQFINTGLAFRR